MRALCATEFGALWADDNALDNVDTTETYLAVHSVDGVEWWLTSGGGEGRGGWLYRWIWGGGDSVEALGEIGTVDALADARSVLALARGRCLVGYADAGDGGSDYGVREYNAGAEVDHTTFDCSIRSMCADAAGNAYAGVASSGDVYRWPGSGTTWTKIADGPGGINAERMALIDDSNIWLAGDDGSGYGRIWFWDGATWTTQHTDARADSAVVGICVASASHAWAVNALGEILRFDGSTWSVIASTSNKMFDIACDGINDVIAFSADAMDDWPTLHERVSDSNWPTRTDTEYWRLNSGSICVVAQRSPLIISRGPYHLITDGRDYDTSGGVLLRDKTIASRCRARVLCQRGKWAPDPSFGSRLWTLKTMKNARHLAVIYLEEALADLIAAKEIEAIHPLEFIEDQATGALGVRVEVVLPREQVVPLGVIPLGVE